jgi:hypothetical protein
MNTPKTGGCACGEIRYQFNEEPLTAVFCYCKDCQRATGSDKFFSLLLKADCFQVTQGNPTMYKTVAQSGNELERYFCPKCGSTLFGKSKALSVVGLAAVSLDDPNTYEPKMAIYTGSAPKWAVIPENLPQFPANPPMS